MAEQMHFISGLPRSGSTLLSGILRQNPALHAGMSSPLAPLVHSCLEQIGAGSEFFTFFDDEKRLRLCHALFNAYYEDKAGHDVIFDTNRIWTARLHQLVQLFAHCKVICCVRSPAWIMDSFERIYRAHPFVYSRMYSPASRLTVYSRCDAMVGATGVFGSAWTALKEAYYGEHSERLLLIDYDLLAQYPKATLALFYEAIGLPVFAHDFDNVCYEETDFDDKLGAKGLHTVQRKVAFKTRPSVLPPDLFAKYDEMAFWRDQTGTAASIIAPKNTGAAAEDGAPLAERAGAPAARRLEVLPAKGADVLPAGDTDVLLAGEGV